MARGKKPAEPASSAFHQAQPSGIDVSKFLSAEEMADITKRAKAKIAARDKLDAEEAHLNAELTRLDAEAHPEKAEEMREITIDLALYADRIILDGKVYFHGSRYTVRRSVYDVMQEIMARTRRHDDEIHSGEPGDSYYRKSRAMSVN